ncbi:MAG TPA: cytochrome c oxidase assembly protein [Acidimicrobiales bacterium]|nr:cytochrome c oxidase assembly protein [Acidimicrobiales bacterium]
MTPGPWAFHLHLVTWVVLAVVTAVYAVLVRPAAPTVRQRWAFAGAVACAAAVLTWPVADLAAHWSLTALVVQRLVLTLVVAPLGLLGVPVEVLGRLTRPRLVDGAVEFLSRPPVAVATFFVVVVGTLAVPAVRVQADSAGLRGLFDGLLLVAGVVLWLPALGRVPGTRALSAAARAGYLVVQSVLPNFPAVIFVFARHPLYPVFTHAHVAIGLSPLNDQQLAGVVAKIGTLPVLWTCAWLALSRGQRADELGLDDPPLTWADVERALERAERSGGAPGGASDGKSPRPDEPPGSGQWSGRRTGS